MGQDNHIDNPSCCSKRQTQPLARGTGSSGSLGPRVRGSVATAKGSVGELQLTT